MELKDQIKLTSKTRKEARFKMGRGAVELFATGLIFSVNFFEV